jgi:hypothetical protein
MGKTVLCWAAISQCGLMLSSEMYEVVIRLLESSEANLMAARAILEDQAAPVTQDTCEHPVQYVRVVRTFGTEIRLCGACGELVGEHDEQS